MSVDKLTQIVTGEQGAPATTTTPKKRTRKKGKGKGKGKGKSKSGSKGQGEEGGGVTVQATTTDQIQQILGGLTLGADDAVGAPEQAVESKGEQEDSKGAVSVSAVPSEGIVPGSVVLTDESMIQTQAALTACNKDFFEIRMAVVGNVDSGKSTLVGVLTGGERDDGRGKARQQVVVHRHEASSGRTSCISQHIVGFDQKGNLVHQTVAQSGNAAAKDKSWRRVIANSKQIMTFIDLAGHEKYLKTTIAGLTGCFPEYAMIIVNSLAGITKMTKEHLGVVLALQIPFIIVVTKLDMCPDNVLASTKKQLWRALRSDAVKKMPINVRSETDVKTCLAAPAEKISPVFFVSCVTGSNMDLLTQYLAGLKPRLQRKDGKDIEFTVDHNFNVPGVGIVVSGTLKKGTVTSGSNLLLGPTTEGTFKKVLVRSIHTNRVPVDTCNAGISCCLCIRSVKRKEPLRRNQLRRGMVLVSADQTPIAYRSFTAVVLILHHASTISSKYQAVIHCGIVRQSAAIVEIEQEVLRTGDQSRVTFRFMSRPEYIKKGQTFIFREGSTKGVGRIVEVSEPYAIETA
jgi:GTPase